MIATRANTNWYAVHTKTHAEDRVSANLGSMGIPVFLPKVKWGAFLGQSRLPGGRPLFPRYLFAEFCPETDLRSVRYARGVRRVVSAGEVPLPVNAEILNHICSRIGEDGYVRLYPTPMGQGERVLVREGPLKGLQGIFERQLDDGLRVLLLLEAVQYQAHVVVEKQRLVRAEQVS